ncbi:MAG: hypothetical protein ACLUD0_15435 [Eubacterium ramulus]
MNIKIIDEKEQFAQCETFEITHLYGGQKQFQKHMEKLPVGKSMDFWWK